MVENDREWLSALYRMLVPTVTVESPVRQIPRTATGGMTRVLGTPPGSDARTAEFEDYRRARAARSIRNRGLFKPETEGAVVDEIANALGVDPDTRRDSVARDDARGGFADRVAQDMSRSYPAPTAWGSRPATVEDAAFMQVPVTREVFGPAAVTRSANAASNLLKSLGPRAGSLASSVMENLRKYAPAPVGAPASPAEALATGAPAPAPVASPAQPTPAAAASPFALPQQPEVGAADAPALEVATDAAGVPRMRTLDELLDAQIYADPEAARAPGAMLPGGTSDASRLSAGTRLNYAEAKDPNNIGQLEVYGATLRDNDSAGLLRLRRMADTGDPEAVAAYQARTAPMLAEEFKRVDTALAAQEMEARQKISQANSASARMQAEAQLSNAKTNRLLANLQAREHAVNMVRSILQGFLGGGAPVVSTRFLEDMEKSTAETRTQTIQAEIKRIDDEIKALRENPVSASDPNLPAMLRSREDKKRELLAQMNKPIIARRLPTGPTGADDADIAELIGIDELNKATGRK